MIIDADPKQPHQFGGGLMYDDGDRLPYRLSAAVGGRRVATPVDTLSAGTVLVCDVCDRGWVVEKMTRTEWVGYVGMRPEGWLEKRRRRRG